MPETLVTVARYFDATEAHIAVGLLESEGIPSYPTDVNHVSANPLLGIGLGGVRLQVPASFAQAARDVLANCKPLEHTDQDDFSVDAPSDATDLPRNPGARSQFQILKVLAIVVLGILALAIVLSTLN